jgi:hypothetical protein
MNKNTSSLLSRRSALALSAGVCALTFGGMAAAGALPGGATHQPSLDKQSITTLASTRAPTSSSNKPLSVTINKAESDDTTTTLATAAADATQAPGTAQCSADDKESTDLTDDAMDMNGKSDDVVEPLSTTTTTTVAPAAPKCDDDKVEVQKPAASVTPASVTPTSPPATNSPPATFQTPTNTKG